MLLDYAAVLFAVGALGGLLMALRSFKAQPIPAPLAALHGVLVASGLVLLIVAALLGEASHTAIIALGALIVAAFGGFFLLSFHIRKQQHPRAVIVVHAVVAVAGFATLLVAILQSHPR